jgi:hypothetical protein
MEPLIKSRVNRVAGEMWMRARREGAALPHSNARPSNAANATFRRNPKGRGLASPHTLSLVTGVRSSTRRSSLRVWVNAQPTVAVACDLIRGSV